MAHKEVVSDISEGISVKDSLGKVADSIKNAVTPASGDAPPVEDESVTEAVSEAAQAIKDSLKDGLQTVSDDKFLGGLAVGIALGAISHYIWQEHGEAIGDGVCGVAAGVGEGIGTAWNKVTGFFTPKRTRNKAGSSSQAKSVDNKSDDDKPADNTFSVKIPPALMETVKNHEKELKKDVLEMIEEYKKKDEKDSTTKKDEKDTTTRKVKIEPPSSSNKK